MNVNTQIWGDPSVWFHRSSAPNITTNCTLSEMRIGASSYDDSDFTDYPATKFCRDICLFGYWRDGYLSSDGETPLDNSLSYTAIANPDLPQMDIRVATVDTNAGWTNKALLQSNPNTVVPFSLATYRDYGQVYNPFYRSSIYGIDGLNYDATIYASQGFQRWCPFGRYDTGANIGNTRWGEYNPNGRLGMIGEFGPKSIILEIIVRRYDGGYYDTATQTLKSYANQSLEWRLAHPILSCYAKPYYRTNKNGTYTDGAPLGYTLDNQMIGLSPVFYRSLYSNATNREYTSYLMGGHGAMSGGYFPIYGPVLSDSGYTSQWVTAGAPYENPTQTSMNNGVYFYGCQRGELIKRPNTGNFQLSLQGTDDNIEWLRKGCAAYGMFFCDEIGTLGNSGRDSGATERWKDPDMYLGIIRQDGMTYGEYTSGETNALQTQYGWKSSTETPFVPGQNINQYSQQTRIRAIGHIDTMCDRYVLNANAVNALSVDLFTIMSDLSVQQTDWGDLIAKTLDSFLVQNPVDCIVSLKKYPVKEIPNTGDLTNIHYGRYSTGSAAGYPCTADVYTYAFTPKRIQSRYGNSYLDYEPHTSAELYIPYCGSISLKMCDILDKQLEPFLCVDYHTGQCTGFVMADGIVIETIQGTIAVDVPITGIQTATVESQLMQSANAARTVRVNQAFSAIEGLGKITLGAKFGGAVGGATGFANAVHTYENLQFQKYQTDYDLTHTAAPQHIIGSSSSACGWIIDSDTARLILYYPTGGVIDDANPPSFIASKVSEFGSIYGFATIESGTLGSYPGLTTATEMILDNITTEHGAPATDQEIEMIRSAISEGVIIPNLQEL